MAASSSLSFPIEKFFPNDKSEYKARCEKNSSLTVNYLIALRQEAKTILPLILKKGVNFQDTEWGFTALHVATLVGNHNLMQVIIRMNANASIEDCGGLMALHYACALHDTKAMTILQEAMKAEKVSTDIFEIYPGWKKVLEPVFPADEEYVVYWKSMDSNGPPTQVTAKTFFERTGAKFHEGVFSNDENFILSLVERVDKQLSHDNVRRQIFNEEFTRQYLEIEKGALKFPLTYVQNQEGAGNGAFAGELILAGRICMTYGGELKPNHSPNSYSLFSVDASENRDMGPFVNDGFPNSAYYRLTLSDGRTVFIIVALRDIQKDEPFFIDYTSSHMVKMTRRTELNYKEMEDFFTKNDPVKVWQDIRSAALEEKDPQKASQLGFKSVLEREYRESNLGYIVNTPSALVTLYLNDVISLNSISDLLMDPTFIKFLKGTNGSDFLQVLDFSVKSIATIEKLQENTHDFALRTEFRKFCLKVIGNFSNQVLNQVLIYMQKKGLGLSGWKAQAKEFEVFVEAVQLVMSAFLPPITEEATNEYLTKCAEKIKLLSKDMKRYVLRVLETSVDSFSPALKNAEEMLRKMCS